MDAMMGERYAYASQLLVQLIDEVGINVVVVFVHILFLRPLSSSSWRAHGRLFQSMNYDE